MDSRIIFATNNKHKLAEARAIIGDKFDILSLEDLGYNGIIPENQDTLEGNAIEKARFIWEIYKINCFADDTGLEVVALNGEPGVYSARYAGPECDANKNILKLLENMKEAHTRDARFRTVIAAIIEGKEYFFEGIINGKIAENARGNNGFGYDPVFIPEGFMETFAELPTELKNNISHRAQAIQNLAYFLRHYAKIE